MKKVWIVFVSVFVLSFAVLIWIGTEVYQAQPPIPKEVVIKETNEVVYTKEDIQIGQNVWESIGGMEVGSIWGHGSYVAPDWTADWIHKEAVYMLEYWAQNDFNKSYESLDVEKKAALKARLIKDVKTNTFDESSENIKISKLRWEAISENIKHYSSIFSDGHEQYAIPEGALTDEIKLEQLNAFLFWTLLGSKYQSP